MNRFTVIERDNCVLIEGALPPKWISALAKMMPKAVISPNLARMLGANFAFGLQKDVDALIASITPAMEKAAVSAAAGGPLSEAAARWLVSGERGISSNTIFTRLTGVDALGDWTQDYPHDPADLRRCRLLLEQCPDLAERFSEMAKASKTWARLVRDWDLLCSMMDKELPEWRTPPKRSSCPETYKLIKLSLGE